jgi:hypothetical protein
MSGSFRRSYHLRRSVSNRNSFQVTFPHEIIEREARAKGLTVMAFMEKYGVVAEYNGGPGVTYTIEERK